MTIELELKQLQQQLAMADLIAQPQASRRADTLELLLIKLQELKIKMYQETGHVLPHVHVDYCRHNHVASYSITEHKRIAGTLPTKYDCQIIAWITVNRDRLLELWRALQTGGNHMVMVGELAGNK